jgi:hypothetical protein
MILRPALQQIYIGTGNSVSLRAAMDNLSLKGIVSRDFEECFLVSFDRSYISKHQEWVLLLLKVRFRVEFLDFRAWA